MPSTETGSQHGALPDQTYERLRDLIVRGRIPPGARVREAEIALRFGVSRTPVREALGRLIHERFLVPSSTGKRTELIAAPFNPPDVRELWSIIGSLESIAIAAVTTLPRVKRSDIADDLQGINARLLKAAQARPRDPDHLNQLQSDFHVRFVYEGAGPYLRNMYDALRPQVQRYEWIYGTRAEADYEPSTSEHSRIIAAIRDGETELARIAIIAHWSKAAKRTAKVIEAVAGNSRA